MIYILLKTFEKETEAENSFFSNLKKLHIGCKIILISIVINLILMFIFSFFSLLIPSLISVIFSFILIVICRIMANKIAKENWLENIKDYNTMLDKIKLILSLPVYNIYDDEHMEKSKYRIKQLISKCNIEIKQYDTQIESKKIIGEH